MGEDEDGVELLTKEEARIRIIEYAHKNKVYPSGRMIIKNIPDIPKTYKQFRSLYEMTPREMIETCNIPYKVQFKQFEYSDDEIIEKYTKISKNIGKTPNFSDIEKYRKLDHSIPTASTMNSRFGSIDNLANISGLTKITTAHGKYKKEYLLSELQRYFREFGEIPTQKGIDFNKNYPSRKTFTSAFGTFNNALQEAGFDIEDKPDYTNRNLLLSEIKRYIEEFGKQPRSEDMDSSKGYPSKSHYQKVFGSWNNALRELDLKVSVSQYTQEELDSAFYSFVGQYGRPPKLHEFNDASKYPSFWCYQSRFGLWNKTLIHYGFEPYDGASGKCFYFENGEVCKSTYEYDISNWLRENNISYLRNIPYRDFIGDYDGKKDCDYVIIHNGEWIWLEIAGLYSNREKKSSMEKRYIKAFDHKVSNLLRFFNHQIFHPDDFVEYSVDELFEFLWDIPECSWDTEEPIYQGVSEDIGDVI